MSSIYKDDNFLISKSIYRSTFSDRSKQVFFLFRPVKVEIIQSAPFVKLRIAKYAFTISCMTPE